MSLSLGKTVGVVGCLALGAFALMFAGVMAISVFAVTNLGGGSGASGNQNLANVKDIPEELKPALTAAAAKHNISPAFLAAIHYKEQGENFKAIDGPWATSPSGANGPFQFIEQTWEGWGKPGSTNGTFETDPSVLSKNGGYGQDGNSDGKADVQNFWDAAFAAAELLGANGAAPNVTDEKKLMDAAAFYNKGGGYESNKCQSSTECLDYVPAVIEAYNRFVSQI